MTATVRSLWGWFALVCAFAACGRPRDEGRRQRDDEPAEFTRTEIDADLGGTAASADGKFSAIIPPRLFDRTVFIVIDDVSDTMPTGIGLVSNAYSVTFTPPEATVIGPTYEIEFVLAPDDVVDPTDLGIGVRQAETGTYESVLVRPYVSWIDWKSALHAQVNLFAAFIALDVEAAGCACDTSTSCQNGCGCDLDCEGQGGCGLGEWECANGDCIPANQECNGSNNCFDGSDEDGHCTAAGGDLFEPDNGFGQAAVINPGDT